MHLNTYLRHRPLSDQVPLFPHCLCDLPIDTEGLPGRPPGRPIIDGNDESTDDSNRRLVDTDEQ